MYTTNIIGIDNQKAFKAGGLVGIVGHGNTFKTTMVMKLTALMSDVNCLAEHSVVLLSQDTNVQSYGSHLILNKSVQAKIKTVSTFEVTDIASKIETTVNELRAKGNKCHFVIIDDFSEFCHTLDAVLAPLTLNIQRGLKQRETVKALRTLAYEMRLCIVVICHAGYTNASAKKEINSILTIRGISEKFDAIFLSDVRGEKAGLRVVYRREPTDTVIEIEGLKEFQKENFQV